jgi:isopentenyl-diphosphate delta-isomerase
MAAVENGLIEHEFDHVFCGEYEGALQLNGEEVAETVYLSMTEVAERLNEHPELFTSWFRIVFPQINDWWRQRYGYQNQNLHT